MNPDLIVRDKQGKPYSVRYDQVNATLQILKAVILRIHAVRVGHRSSNLSYAS
jgi:hypothetical protein